LPRRHKPALRNRPAVKPKSNYRNRRTGKTSNARIQVNTASSTIAASLTGKEISQIKGANARASSAIGQQSTNNKHHPIQNIAIFMAPFFSNPIAGTC
jgi:hypothetical protein